MTGNIKERVQKAREIFNDCVSKMKRLRHERNGVMSKFMQRTDASNAEKIKKEIEGL